MRHTAVTLMLAAGVPERVIMEIMGHSAVSMTRLYGRVMASSRRDAVGRVDALLASATSETKPDGYILGLHGEPLPLALPAKTSKRREKP